jgi:hypothetical protein
MPGQPTVWNSTLTVEVSSVAPGDLPVWVDISDTVKVAWSCAAGRQTELSSSDPGVATLTLINDGRYTTGNPTAYAWWKQGRRIRIRETVGYLTVDLFDGYIERPRGSQRIDEANAAAPQDAVVSVSAVDILGRLSHSAKLISTLGAHIKFHGGQAMKGLWPMGGADRTWPDAIGMQSPLDIRVADATNLDTDQVAPGNGAVAPADDLSVVHLAYLPPAGQLDLRTATSETLEAGQVLTVVVWVNMDSTTTATATPITIQVAETPTLTGTIVVSFNPAEEGVVSATLTGLNLTGTITGSAGNIAKPTAIAVRYGYSPNVFELWVTDQVYSTTPGGSAPTATTVSEVRFGGLHNGFLGYAQMYVGAAADWTSADFAAQYAMGLSGLEWQTTGERVATIADYAGIPTGARDIDRGAAVMSVARLAGRFPADALDEATDTEQGRLFVAGGRLTFRDRRSVYDI